MAKPKLVGSLQIGQDLEFQRREWTVQRVAWVVVAIVLLAGIVGVFGGGPLSHAAASSGPLSLEYDRFTRKRAPTDLTLRLDPGTAVDGEIALWLDRAFLDKVDVERVSPEPREMEAAAERVIYRFAVADPEQLVEVVFALQPAEPGIARGRLGLIDGAEVAFDQFIYP